MSTAIDLCSWRAVSTTPRRTPHDSHHRPRDAPRVRALPDSRTLPKFEGAGKARCRLTPAARLRKKMQAAGTTGSAGATRPSLRDGFHAYGALSSVRRLSGHRHRRGSSPPIWHQHRDAGTTRFHVRIAIVRRRDLSRCDPTQPSHHRPTFRNDREASLLWAVTAPNVRPICPTAQRPSGCDKMARRAQRMLGRHDESR